jgi:Protein of unknown function (DUF4446)
MVAIVAIAIAVATGAGLALVYRKLQRFQRNQHVIMGSRGTVDIVEHVTAVDEKLTNVRLALEDLTLAARDHDVRIDSSLSRVGIVRFDAYQDLGGRQSTAVAFLNSLSDGVVVTTVVSRDFARMYVKLLKEGAADIPLAPEESEAVAQAAGSGPFTIRPRVEGSLAGDAGMDGEAAALTADSPISVGLPGRRARNDREVAQENRRRKRQGLPLVQDAVTPSATGWAERQTLAPADGSLAERFLQERKTARRRPDGDDDQVSGASEEGGGGREL